MDKIEELLTRGVANIIPSKKELGNLLRSGKKLRVYQGFDPTSPDLHIGHMLGLKKLRQWQDLGHEVIFLIGDFTGMVGDPTGRDKTREPLSREQVLENAKTYKEQAGRIVRFKGKNPVQIKYNSEWLSKLPALEIAKLMSLLTVQQILERDMFRKRIKNDQEISMVEVTYPIMQGYDSVAMNVDVEIGGTDQLFNMMVGRDMMRKIKGKNKFVITTPLLTDASGEKIGKTEGNTIALTDKPEDLFAKLMRLPDEIIGKGFEYLTNVSMSEITEIYTKLKLEKNPIIFKKRLAFEIVKQLNDESSAQKAQEHFEKTVQKKEAPEKMETHTLKKSEERLADILVETKLASSKSDAQRLVEQGGVSIDGTKTIDPNEIIELKNERVIKVGKHRFVKIRSTN
ncbi:MAG: tyrosine--tRNA ligase [Candidatus Levybacteria bacterium RIFCSPLOWO2_01_FULL_38_21]|nr:MAG: tyrosine--tRNA ligase [Candidatus Levybacteria bacterium RIFCSPLOWO2_01_FULL_38_21]